MEALDAEEEADASVPPTAEIGVNPELRKADVEGIAAIELPRTSLIIVLSNEMYVEFSDTAIFFEACKAMMSGDESRTTIVVSIGENVAISAFVRR